MGLPKSAERKSFETAFSKMVERQLCNGAVIGVDSRHVLKLVATADVHHGNVQHSQPLDRMPVNAGDDAADSRRFQPVGQRGCHSSCPYR